MAKLLSFHNRTCGHHQQEVIIQHTLSKLLFYLQHRSPSLLQTLHVWWSNYWRHLQANLTPQHAAVMTIINNVENQMFLFIWHLSNFSTWGEHKDSCNKIAVKIETTPWNLGHVSLWSGQKLLRHSFGVTLQLEAHNTHRVTHTHTDCVFVGFYCVFVSIFFAAVHCQNTDVYPFSS